MQTVHVDPMSGAQTTLFVLRVDRGLDWEVNWLLKIFPVAISCWLCV